MSEASGYYEWVGAACAGEHGGGGVGWGMGIGWVGVWSERGGGMGGGWGRMTWWVCARQTSRLVLRQIL